MLGDPINWYAVIGAAIASMALGFAWYSKNLFGKSWMQEMGLTDAKIASQKQQMNKTYAISTVAAIITAYVFAHVLNAFNSANMTMALQGAFWMWLGFFAPVQLTSILFDNKSWRLFGINTGYQLVSLVIMSIILTMWS